MSVSMISPTWYDLLDVDPSASTDDIRAAWKAAIADLDPTDRRFRTLNEAAAVLLDADKREAYDAGLAEQQALVAEESEEKIDDEEAGLDEAEVNAPADLEKPGEEDADAELEAEPEPEASEDADAGPTRRTITPPRWVTAAVGILAIAALIAAVVVFMRGGTKVVTTDNRNATTSTLDANYGAPITHDHTTLLESQAEDALAAAKTAVVPLLSYDYRHLAADQQKAHTYMTASYRKEYDKLFALIKDNAPAAKTVVKTLPPVDSGITRVSSDRVQVLLFVDRPTSNAKTSKPIPYQDYVSLIMVHEHGKWLVDSVITKPASN